jgi:outer membrane immunogenic protein
LSTVALAALAGTAFAADLPSRRAPPVYAPPPPIPVFTWTGGYIGGQLGYEFGNDQKYGANSRNGIVVVPGASTKPSGVIGGAHIGYNYSTQGLPIFGGFLGAGGVIGIEGDVDGTSTTKNYPIGPIGASYRETIEGSVRGRLGFAFDRVLAYGTGGVAFGGIKNSYNFGTLQDSSTTTRVGYTVGGGIEYAVTNNIAVRVEYRYTDFGNYTNTLSAITAGGLNVRHRDTDNRVQAGISYKFDVFAPVAPVVARY